MSFIRTPHRVDQSPAGAAWIGIVVCTLILSGCAQTTSSMKIGQAAERAGDLDRAVAEYNKAARERPDDTNVRVALGRAKLKAAQEHYLAGRRFSATQQHDRALVEFQLASELNPSDANVESALRDTRQKLRTKLAVDRGGKTELETLVEQSRDVAPPGLELPPDLKLPDSLVFSRASSRTVFTALGRFTGLNVIFDPAFQEAPISVDLRNATVEGALTSLTASTRTFYRVTARNTVTIVPDTPAKRREYEESVVRTFYLSNADVKEVIDLLRVVIDIRQVSPISATNAISIKDTPERIAAASRLIAAIDKARPELVIDVELLEVDRTRLQEYGLQIASPGQPGISGSADVNRDNLTLYNLRNLTAADVLMSGVPALYYRLLKSDQNTRTLANPQLRTSEGLPATARFGEMVPVPITTFAPIATGGVNQQPITSFEYRNIGVNIDITPRTHHDDEVSLALKVSLSNISGTGFGGLPTFGNREITTTIRLKDGETNMLAGLIRDNERTVLEGVPGLSDLPLVGKLFAKNHKEAQQTDIILTLTPHIIRVLDLTPSDLRPFLLGREGGSTVDLPQIQLPPRDKNDPLPTIPGTTQAPLPAFPQPLQPKVPPKKPGGGGG